MDDFKEFCGIIGITNHDEAAEMAYLSLYSMQHRGQEGAGIISSDGRQVYRHVGLGLINEVFEKAETIRGLKGRMAIGHTRYSTTGSNSEANVQPICVNSKDGPLALAHNGNLVNSKRLRDKLQQEGAIFQTTTDSEIIVHLICRSQAPRFLDRIQEALRQLRGAFSLLIMTPEMLIAARDPHAIRPLALGKAVDSLVIASETCAMDLIGAEYIRDVEPGELIVIDKEGMKSESIGQAPCRKHCIFEFIYFSRPDSRIFGEYVDKTRRKLGKQLAQEHPADADIVISVPDSSNTAALGFARRMDLKFELGLIRNHYIGRTFIQPHQEIRDFNVKVKFNPVGGVLQDRRVVVVEDSIVRGTTLRLLTSMLRRAGAREVHIRVSSPPVRFPCYYGMDFPTRDELIANTKTVQEIQAFLNVDSLGYLSLDGLLEAAPGDPCHYCTACFNGDYPVPVDDFSKTQHES
ncbi:amidophosphoribosyltransferase [bacterium]|nr:amidophosphoribosyltransferase [bacterium]